MLYRLRNMGSKKNQPLSNEMSWKNPECRTSDITLCLFNKLMNLFSEMLHFIVMDELIKHDDHR